MACAEPGDRGVIGGLICADDPGRDILVAATLDRPRGPLPQRIAVEQQRDHHRRIMDRPPVTIGAIGAVELGKIDLGDDINHRRGEVIVPEPLAQHNKARQRRALRNSPKSGPFPSIGETGCEGRGCWGPGLAWAVSWAQRTAADRRYRVWQPEGRRGAKVAPSSHSRRSSLR
jgi:hypothetical protein